MMFKLLQVLQVTAGASLLVVLLSLYLICMVIATVLESRQQELLGGVPRRVCAAMVGPLPNLRRWMTFALAAAYIVTVVVPGVPDGLPGILLVALLASVTADALTGWRHRQRLYRQITRADYRVCTSCMHRLGGLGGEGPCPGCGQAFSAAKLRTTWQQWLDPDTGDLPGVAALRHVFRVLRARRNTTPAE